MNWFPGHILPSRATVDSCHGSLERRKKGPWGGKVTGLAARSSLLLERRLSPSELPGIFWETQAFLPPPPKSSPICTSSWARLQWHPGPYGLTDLSLFKAGDGHEDVVEVSAAPPQHVHPLLASFLPQFIDGIFCARGREGQRGKELTPNRSTLNSGDIHFPEMPQVLRPYLSWVLKSSQIRYMKQAEMPRRLETDHQSLQGLEEDSACFPRHWALLIPNVPIHSVSSSCQKSIPKAGEVVLPVMQW